MHFPYHSKIKKRRFSVVGSSRTSVRLSIPYVLRRWNHLEK